MIFTGDTPETLGTLLELPADAPVFTVEVQTVAARRYHEARDGAIATQAFLHAPGYDPPRWHELPDFLKVEWMASTVVQARAS